MKRTITLLIFFIFCAWSATGQLWFELGGKAMIGPTGYYNKNIFDDKDHNYRVNFTFSYGLAAGLNLGELHGFNLEGLLAKHQQEITFKEGGENRNNRLQWESIDWYVLYRYYPESAVFFEVGPKLTTVRTFDQTYDLQRVEDVAGNYNAHYFSAVAGLGGFLAGSEVFTLKSGIRLEYALSDLVSAEGMDEGFPAFYTSYNTYTQTRPFRAAFYLELNFAIGGIAKMVCGRRRFVAGQRYR